MVRRQCVQLHAKMQPPMEVTSSVAVVTIRAIAPPPPPGPAPPPPGPAAKEGTGPTP